MNTYTRHSKVKVIKVALVYEIKAYGGVEVWLHS